MSMSRTDRTIILTLVAVTFMNAALLVANYIRVTRNRSRIDALESLTRELVEIRLASARSDQKNP